MLAPSSSATRRWRFCGLVRGVLDALGVEELGGPAPAGASWAASQISAKRLVGKVLVR